MPTPGRKPLSRLLVNTSLSKLSWVYASALGRLTSNPTDNAFIESFNGKFRQERLNAHWFMSLDDARSKMEEWREDYNNARPHSAIGNKPPGSLMNGSTAAKPP